MAKVGYARTSTIEQMAGIEAQVRELQAAGCEKIFKEHVSAVKQRDELDKAFNYVREGDEFIITHLDRLARSVSHFLRLHDELKQKGVTLRILNMGFDLESPTGKLLITLIASFAEMERGIMLERQKEGIAKAKKEGKYIGRKPLPDAVKDSVKALIATGASKIWIAKHLSIGQASVFRIAKEMKEKPSK